MKRERFDEIICFDVAAEITSEIDEFLICFENVTDLDIENFVVVLSEIDEIVDEIVVDEIVVEILFFSLLKFRFEVLIISFFIDLMWCWRRCSWNLFFESKISSQCLQTIFLQTIFWVCCNNRVNDEKNAKQFRHEWYCDEKIDEVDETAEVSNFENFVENAVIKTSSHSLRFFLTISLSLSRCCLYHVNADSRRQSSNKISRFDSRYWCWRCRNCCRKLAISQNRLNFCISQTSVASKNSISTTMKVDFAIFKIFNSIAFEVFFSSCMASEHCDDCWRCFFSDFFIESNNVVEQWIHCVLNQIFVSLNSATIKAFFESTLRHLSRLASLFSYVSRNLTSKTKRNSIFDFATIFFDSTFCWSCWANEQCDAFRKCFCNDLKM